MAPKDISSTPLDFLRRLNWEDIPAEVQHQAKRCLLDILGVAAGGHGTDLSRIIRDHAAEDMPGRAPMLFDGRRSSLSGAAMAAGMMIDSLDGHDGWNPVKGHIGAPLLPGLLAFGNQAKVSGQQFLEAMVAGYEIGGRGGAAQHATCPDYHTSGSWGGVAVAAAGARLADLSPDKTRHALGIAEYHGPRSQMMRCIDVPSMVKDGAGWGALCGVSAVQLAQRGFTGAPAITIEDAAEHFEDLGTRWIMSEQYFKPYPVCRWAQAPVEGVLALRSAHGLVSTDVDHIAIETFHESCRLAVAEPQTTEEAQYSTSFPCAVALVRGALGPEDLQGAMLHDPQVLRLSRGLQMSEHEFANTAFPHKRFAKVTLRLKSGAVLQGDWIQPLWDADRPPSDTDLLEKFHSLADPVLGRDRAARIVEAIWMLETRPLSNLTQHLFAAPSKTER